MPDNDDIDSIAAQLELQQAKGEAIRQQMQNMQASMLEVTAAMEAIRNLKNAGKDVLVPVGAGAYISCPKPDTERVVVGIGANLMVQKKPEEALKLMEERQKMLANAVKAAQEDLEMVVKEIDELSKRASLLASGANQNVRASKG